LKRTAFSIVILEAKKKDTEASSSYFSLSSYISKPYVVYKINTKSNLPMYLQGGKSEEFTVFRRYSDFEFLLMRLQENFKNVCFPELPPKKMIGNMEDTHIEKRRLELEGFLRVLI